MRTLNSINKPSTIWCIAALCVFIILSALGIVTYRLVQQDRIQTENIYEADKQGRIRVAMWRMDTLATSIIQNEDERSVYEFNNPEHLPLPNDALNKQANSLYYSSPETSKLYWNIVPQQNSKVISPQVYNQPFLISNGIDPSRNPSNAKNLDQLETIFAAKTKPLPNSSEPSTSYKALACTAAHVSLDQWGNRQAIANNTIIENDFSYKSQALNKTAVLKRNEPQQQAELSTADRNSRAKNLSRIQTKKISAWQANTVNSPLEELEQPEQPEQSSEQTRQNNTPKASKAPNPPKSQSSYTYNSNDLNYVSDDYTPEPFSSPFASIWVNKELMLVRKVSYVSGDIVQGVWMDKAVLIEKFLTEIKDLFPDATLIPVEQSIDQFLAGKDPENSHATMLKFPFKLQTNEDNILHIHAITYFKGPIGLAWIAAIMAILASFFMLRGVLNMSERRASFVSSVTHELRTPLTTFRLYSDLLSTGMVREENKRQNYLGTLKKEADRLTHLVDNVLSYSQIEKGSAKAKIEQISISNLMSRMEDRLNERASEDLMLVNIVYNAEVAHQNIQADTTAVEQIIFNLVDNACKYASGEEYSDQLEIKIHSNQKAFFFQVCDEGPGIDAKETKRLFRAFHKSAKEAADTKPGVGLGLALCRRLAHAMKGDLTILPTPRNQGACFQLKMPRN